MFNNLLKNFRKKLLSFFIFIAFILVGAAVAVSFFEPDKTTSSFAEPDHIRDKGDWFAYGRGWVPNASGAGSGELSSSTCASASSTGGTTWFWFEDANGDSDTTDEEDGLCVKATSTVTASTPGTDSWNGTGGCSTYDNSYIPAYTCAGNFPSGYVASYSGVSSACTDQSDNTWNDGDCALCQADCYDGKKDLPAQGGYNAPNSLNHGPLTSEILKNWKGTRLPSSEDYYGFCGSGGSGSTGNYRTGCSSDTTAGTSGHQNGRTDECMSLSNYGTHEWLSERHSYISARVAGHYACSYFHNNYVEFGSRFRAVFRP